MATAEDFTFITEKAADGTRHHYLVCRGLPGFKVYLQVSGADQKLSPMRIDRVVVPNSWIGEYHQYGRALQQAEAFVRRVQQERDPRSPVVQ